MNEIKHYGTPRKSGRYPWGSGDDPYQNNKSFLAYVTNLRKEGMTEKQIADAVDVSTTKLRAMKSIAKAEQRNADVAMATRLKDKGYSNVAIGERMGINESSVRSLLDPAIKERADIVTTTANMLREQTDKKNYIDIGVGIENQLGVRQTQLKTAIAMLEEDGYKVQYLKVEQLGAPGNYTYVKVLTKPDVEWPELNANKHKIGTIGEYSEDGGRSFLGLEPVRSIDSSRIKIVYNEDGGSEKDGVIELRRDVDELSLGTARYAQVRVGVDGTHFLKGMAIYSDDMPEGIDILYNTNKGKDVPASEVFKPMKDDPDNPFGSIIRQKHYIDKDGNKQLSALNIMGPNEGDGEEGYWNEWSRTLSSQFLSKQPIALAQRQLGLAYDIKKQEYDEIMELTNPAVKKRLLTAFADDCDGAAVHLKAAALPRQGNHVLLPIPSLKENEIYAPNYNNGDIVALVRHPHGGKFEIPELMVNNRHPQAKKMLGQAKDAVGINAKVAERLSGADFDGDTVLVIPNNPKVGVKSSPALKGLKDFDPKIMYKGFDGMQVMKKANIGRQMGDISNLITDMTIKGANPTELAAAVRHSMVVIDAHKHKLNYKQSYDDNGISALKTKYQGGPGAGAATLISKASSDERVGLRKLKTNTKKMTPSELADYQSGKKVWEYTGDTYTDKKGKVILRQTKSKKMAEVSDANELSSGTPMESVYASHANKLKALANTTRKEALNTTPTPYSPSANKAYAKEVARLDAALNVALKNAPLERKAQLVATNIVTIKKKANPDMTNEELKKIKSQALNEARNRTGAGKKQIEISNREWEAIQAGAVSNTKLTKILNNTNLDNVKQLATPRPNKSGLSSSKVTRAKAMLKSGSTQAEVAAALGVSVSMISNLD